MLGDDLRRRDFLLGAAAAAVPGAVPDVAADVARDILAERSRLLATAQTSHDVDRTIRLIATTSTLEPGASRTLAARGYPIDIADRTAIRKWINELRSPGTGIFLAT